MEDGWLAVEELDVKVVPADARKTVRCWAALPDVPRRVLELVPTVHGVAQFPLHT